MTVNNPNLRQMRRLLKMNLAQVSKAVGIPKSTISDIENETHQGSYVRVMTLFNFYTKQLEEQND